MPNTDPRAPESSCYDIAKHRHNFAVWAAARAAQRGFKGATVPALQQALEGCGILEFLGEADWDTVSEQNFAEQHRKWCLSAIQSLRAQGVPSPTFGLAVKLIAVYIKSAVVLGDGTATALARVAHPPIDAILLRNLSVSPEIDSPHKKSWRKVAWTRLTEEDYYPLMQQLRDALKTGQPFWTLEHYWTVTDRS